MRTQRSDCSKVSGATLIIVMIMLSAQVLPRAKAGPAIFSSHLLVAFVSGVLSSR
jgi:hypothetical protein